MILRRNFIAIAFAVFVATAIAPRPASATSSEKASGFLTQLANSTVAVLQVKGTPLDVREAKIRDLLRNNFDFYRIGRYVMGRAWRSSSKAQQKEFLTLFGRTCSAPIQGGWVVMSVRALRSLAHKHLARKMLWSRPSSHGQVAPQ